MIAWYKYSSAIDLFEASKRDQGGRQDVPRTTYSQQEERESGKEIESARGRDATQGKSQQQASSGRVTCAGCVASPDTSTISSAAFGDRY